MPCKQHRAPLGVSIKNPVAVNMESLNPVSYCGRVPYRFRGYRIRHGNEESGGERAEPIVSLQQSKPQSRAL